jgi:high-affinity iron transporter
MTWKAFGRVAAAFSVLAVLPALPARLIAQENPTRRVANVVSVAVEEYGKGVDARGRLISADEYQETIEFLRDAQLSVTRLPGDRVAQARILLDSIVAAVGRKEPPAVLAAIAKRFEVALGSDAQLELPNGPLDVAQGRQLYEQTCASCHGPRGLGDGPAAAALKPRPPAIGASAQMAAVTPGMEFRKMSVGVSGTAMPAFGQQLTAGQRWNVVAYLTSLRADPGVVAEGEGLYAQNCASCHGVSGASDGAVATALSKLPPELGSFAWQAQRSDSEIAHVVRGGIPGTPMPPGAGLTPSQVRAVVAYVRTLPLRNQATSFATGRDSATTYAAKARQSISLLEQSLTSARNGRSAEAGDRAFDAYLAFEPIETPARARDPGLVASMEHHFADFKAAVRANDIRGAERMSAAIEAGMPRILDLTRPTGSGSEAFLQSFLIILREGFEAILVIGAVVAFLLKTGHRERLRSIWTGIALALAASAVTAVVLKTLLGAIPASREIIEGLTLLVAVVVLFSVSYWLISRVEAAKWQQFIREKVTSALDHGGGRALAFVAFLAVYREGAETALFYQALFSENTHVVWPITLGIVVGFGVLAVIFTLFYRFGVRIPLRPFFSITSVLLYYMAFVFAGKGVRELQEGNAVGIAVIPGFPTVDALGIYPTWQTLMAQLVLVALFVFAVVKTFWPKRSVTLPTVPSSPPAPELADAIAALREEVVALRDQVAELEERSADDADAARRKKHA